MYKKIIALLLLSAILFSGCSSSNSTSNKTSSTKKSNITVPKTGTLNSVTDSQKQAATITNSEVKDTPKKAISPPLTSTEKAKVNDKVNSVVNSVDDALNSLDDAKDLDLN